MPNMSPAEGLPIGSLSGGGLEILFGRDGDRCRHMVAGVMQSLDGTPHEIWPASPPLQSLLIERRPRDAQVALLVGMAGVSHWSLSAELDPHARTATFDVACRAKRGPPSLASSYVLAAGVQTCAEGDSKTQLRLTPGVILESLPVDDIPPARLKLDAERRILTIVPIVEDIALPHTFRWRYRITLKDPC